MIDEGLAGAREPLDRALVGDRFGGGLRCGEGQRPLHVVEPREGRADDVPDLGLGERLRRVELRAKPAHVEGRLVEEVDQVAELFAIRLHRDGFNLTIIEMRSTLRYKPQMRVLLLTLVFLGGCGSSGPDPGATAGGERPSRSATPVPAPTPAPDDPPAVPAGEHQAFALAIHGGAGAPSRTLDLARRRAYVRSLAGVLREGCDALGRGGSSLDVVERIVRTLEDDPQFNAGRGAVFTREGRHELDASIMDGRELRAGAVAGVTTVRNPIALARAVMERTPHVLLAGDGAEAFAREVGMQPVPNEWFSTEARRESLRRAIDAEPEHGTVGAVALDRDGNLAAATSTGGLTAKRWGRIGDSPIVGAGTYADNRTCAVSGTGTGEEFIRHAVAHSVSARMQLAGETVQQAAEAVVHGTLREGDGGVIAVSNRGDIAIVFNTDGMFRGACDAGGRFEVRIWEDAEELPE